jgi:hypothetical protein
LFAGEGGEDVAGTDLDEEIAGVAEQLGEVVREADGAAQMTGPVGRVGGFFLLNPRAGDVGEIGQPRRMEGDGAETLFECAGMGSIIVEWKAWEVTRRREAIDCFARRSSSAAIEAVGPETTHMLGLLMAASDRVPSR